MPCTTNNAGEYMQAVDQAAFEDGSTATRKLFTKHLLDVPMPASFVHEVWLSHTTIHQTLLEKLAQHPAMAPNLQQTYDTPANSKNKVYFMWDFVGATLRLLFRMDPELSK